MTSAVASAVARAVASTKPPLDLPLDLPRHSLRRLSSSSLSLTRSFYVHAIYIWAAREAPHLRTATSEKGARASRLRRGGLAREGWSADSGLSLALMLTCSGLSLAHAHATTLVRR